MFLSAVTQFRCPRPPTPVFVPNPIELWEVFPRSSLPGLVPERSDDAAKLWIPEQNPDTEAEICCWHNVNFLMAHMLPLILNIKITTKQRLLFDHRQEAKVEKMQGNPCGYEQDEPSAVLRVSLNTSHSLHVETSFLQQEPISGRITCDL